MTLETPGAPRRELLPSQRCCLGVLEFRNATAIAAFLDHGTCLCDLGFFSEQASAVQVYIGHKEPHVAACGDLPGFVQIRPSTAAISLGEANPGASEQAKRNIVSGASGSQPVGRLINFRLGAGDRRSL